MKTYVTTIVTKPESLFLSWMFWAATVQKNLSSNVSLPRKYLQPSLKRHPPSRAKPSSSAAPGISLAAPLKSTFLFSVTPLGSSLKLQTLSKKKPHKSSLSPQKDLCSPRLSPNDPNKSSPLLKISSSNSPQTYPGIPHLSKENSLKLFQNLSHSLLSLQPKRALPESLYSAGDAPLFSLAASLLRPTSHVFPPKKNQTKALLHSRESTPSLTAMEPSEKYLSTSAQTPRLQNFSQSSMGSSPSSQISLSLFCNQPPGNSPPAQEILLSFIRSSC